MPVTLYFFVISRTGFPGLFRLVVPVLGSAPLGQYSALDNDVKETFVGPPLLKWQPFT